MLYKLLRMSSVSACVEIYREVRVPGFAKDTPEKASGFGKIRTHNPSIRPDMGPRSIVSMRTD